MAFEGALDPNPYLSRCLWNFQMGVMHFPPHTTHTYSMSTASGEQVLVILHINDVYQVKPVDGVGGLSPLYTLVKAERSRAKKKYGDDCPVLFVCCGDFLSASHLGEVHKGKHMVELFNAMEMDYVCFGNHEFDFGNRVLRERMKESHFKWIGSNVLELDKVTGFGGGYVWDTMCADNGLKIGLVGVCTLETPNLSYPDEDVVFAPILPSTEKAVHHLREKEKCDLVIALNHVSLPHDKMLARKVEGINVVLGGHDHTPATALIKDTFVHKSGESASHLMRLECFVTPPTPASPGKCTPQWKMIRNAYVDEDEMVNEVIEKYMKDVGDSGTEILCKLSTPLDSRHTRTRETTMGNVVADALFEAFKPHGCDIAIINGGFIRGNRLYQAGHMFTLGDVRVEFPFPKTGVMVKVTGKVLLDLLEAGVRAVEDGAGFLPIPSASMMYSFDPSAPRLRRIVRVTISGESLMLDKTYNIIVTDYLKGGGDGYPLDSLPSIPTPLDNKRISSILTEYFKSKECIERELDGRIGLV